MRAADDTDIISRRLRELAIERDRILACSCSKEIGEGGEIITLRNMLCPVHANDIASALGALGYRVVP